MVSIPGSYRYSPSNMVSANRASTNVVSATKVSINMVFGNMVSTNVILEKWFLLTRIDNPVVALIAKKVVHVL